MTPQAAGGYLVVPTAEDLRALVDGDARLPGAAAAGGHPSSMINVSIDMLLGGAGAGAGRAEARMGDWSTDGQAPDPSTVERFAGARPTSASSHES